MLNVTLYNNIHLNISWIAMVNANEGAFSWNHVKTTAIYGSKSTVVFAYFLQ